MSSANVYDICKYIRQHCNASCATLSTRSSEALVCCLPSYVAAGAHVCLYLINTKWVLPLVILTSGYSGYSNHITGDKLSLNKMALYKFYSCCEWSCEVAGALVKSSMDDGSHCCCWGVILSQARGKCSDGVVLVMCSTSPGVTGTWSVSCDMCDVVT